MGRMALTLFALVFVASSAVCFGQTTVGTPAFSPKSACGIGALKCYTDNEAAMTEYFDVINFADGCQIYKKVIDCMTSVGDCNSDADFRVVRSILDADQDGICGVDGTILSCGLDVQKCFNEMESVMSDVLVSNFTGACPLMITFVACANTAISQNECPPSLVTKMKLMQQKLNDDQDAYGCGGPCPQAVGSCTKNAQTLPTDQTVLTMDLKAFCKSASQVYGCLNNQTTIDACGSSSQSYIKDIAQNELTKIGDVCTADGNPAPCVKDLADCAPDLSGINHGSDVDAQCKASSEFLECISKLPCVRTLAPLVAKYSETVQTIEIELQCPSVGSCNDRWTQCGQKDEVLVNLSISNKQENCNAAAKAHKCFEFVKNDPFCINEKNSFSNMEAGVDMLYQIQCGGGGGASWFSASWFVHLPLFVAAMMASLKQYF